MQNGIQMLVAVHSSLAPLPGYFYSAGVVETEWLPVKHVARIEASSEDAGHPIDDALASAPRTEWRAAEPGPQVIEIRFKEVRHVRRIRLVIDDADQARTQELTLSWSSRRGEQHRTIVRQQFNFSPTGATREVEEYEVDLPAAKVLQLRIVPDINGTTAVARVTEFLVG